MLLVRLLTERYSFDVVYLIILTSIITTFEHLYFECVKVSRCHQLAPFAKTQISDWRNWKKKDLLTPSNQVVVFHSHIVSAEHTNDHDIKMESFYTHPSERRWEQIVQAHCYNTAKDLQKYIIPSKTLY